MDRHQQEGSVVSKMSARSGQSSYRDRTQEFLTVAERLRKSVSSASNAQSSNVGSKLEGPKSAVSIQSEFNKRASRIGLGIYQTSQKLAKLTKLARRTSVFDDPTVEIQELTAVIKHDITALNSEVVDLQLLFNSQNDSGNISSDTSSHSATVVDNLKNRLMSTTEEFKEVLTMRTENLKLHDNRRQLFSSSASKDPTNPFIRQRPLSRVTSDSAAPPAPWANDSASTSQLFLRKKTNGDPSSSSSPSQPLLQQQQQQQQLIAPLQDNYIHSRAEALQNVESTIHELSSIFTQLATMVSQQGELAIRIDENMDDSLANVEGAQSQLLKYLNSISSNRWLMMKIFFVLIVFLMIFVFFVA
ncbi:syntaxin-32-like [Phalaenopsis equestris]|uniref:syntaxin-32-like n=1 Tax=Phalaenopsis equestris TaxID=78828 RepID=UPI0009E418A6|nr:syntaxin-32-like [Phalaenopsis equestris]